MSLRFTGHETFVVRTFWPKKGYDFIYNGGTFSADNAVVDLGVGKNMVASIQFWMKALGLFNDEKKELTEIAHFLFGEHGVDPYLEDIASVWLLHYHLVRSNYSSIYNLVFNELRKERAVFKKEQLASFIKRKYSENSDNYYNPNTIDKDISIFTRLYKKVDYKSISKNFEDEISGLMLELELITSTIEEEVKEGTNKKEKVEWFYLHGENRNNLPTPILLFSILDNFEGASNIAVRRLQIEANSPNMVFLLSKDALYNKLKELENLVSGITISETAGNVILVLPEGLDKWKILRDYYAN